MPDVDQIRVELSGQLTSPVRWTETIQLMLNQGITTFVEFGPKGRVEGTSCVVLIEVQQGLRLRTAADIQAILEA